jgi:predicted LPLAT superfamily acyltransferase
MVDRFIAKTNPLAYTFNYTNISQQKEILSKGAVILYSHFGCWAASSSVPLVNSKINIVMQEELLSGIKKIENKLEKKSNINIIDLNNGALQTSIQIANALMNDEIVVMMADRSANKKGDIKTSFFGKDANFNKNPFQIAYKTSKPILVYFIVLEKKQTYKVVHINIDMDKSLKEEQSVKKALDEYVKKYEEVIKIYPNQWFNFYNFWEK